ncbi:hypothetical protein E2C01_064971 [Portunus trituberculatus]|uniref:Uncharacterized protein n=1 Tax=Portunus trituberculatus TaxID=210409 RepID=A0A5B7HND8_PORTR|nr:hypothetical protein [Portunus trituberculatus]
MKKLYITWQKMRCHSAIKWMSPLCGTRGVILPLISPSPPLLTTFCPLTDQPPSTLCSTRLHMPTASTTIISGFHLHWLILHPHCHRSSSSLW